MELSTAVTTSLQRGFLVRLAVDEYYIPDRRAYRNLHRIHDVLITASSHDGTAFELMGYCADRRYRGSACSLEELSQGYFGAVGKYGPAGFLAFRAEMQRPVVANPRFIKLQLECFLESKSPPQPTPGAATGTNDSLLYGLRVFDVCVEYTKGLRATEWLDRRVFSLAAEHSETMLRRTRRLGSALQVQIDEVPAERATQISSRLKMLSLLPDKRRSEAFLAEMEKLFRDLKHESQKAAETLWQALN